MPEKLLALESETGFKALFRYATIGIIVIDNEGLIKLINPLAEGLFGYSREELVGKSIEILIPENSRDSHQKHRQDYFKKPKVRPMGKGMELYARHKEGATFRVEISLGHFKLKGIQWQ